MHFSDKILQFISGLKRPVWIFYATLFVFVGLSFNVLAWALGYLAFADFEPQYFLLGVWFVETLLINHLLVIFAKSACEGFQPLMTEADQPLDILKEQVSRIEALPGNVYFIAGFVVGVAVSNYAVQNMTMALEVPRLFVWATAGVGFGLTGIAVYRSIHQLRIVRGLIKNIPSFSLYDLSSIYSIALFPAAVISLNIAFLWINPAVLVFPDMFRDPVFLQAWVVISLFPAVVISPFFFSVRTRLVDEKERLLRANGKMLVDSEDKLYQAIQSKDLSQIDLLEKSTPVLFAYRKEIESISTWPWRRETIRWLSTALILPIAIWLIQVFLQNLILGG